MARGRGVLSECWWRLLGGVVTEGRAKALCCAFTGQGELGGVSAPVVTAWDEWSLSRPQPSRRRCTDQGETGRLSVAVVIALKGWSLGEATAPTAASPLAKGRYVSLSMPVVAEGRLEPCCCECIGQAETGCLCHPGILGANGGGLVWGGEGGVVGLHHVPDPLLRSEAAHGHATMHDA